MGNVIKKTDDGRKEVTDQLCLKTPRLPNALPDRREQPSVLLVHWGMSKGILVNNVAKEIQGTQ